MNGVNKTLRKYCAIFLLVFAFGLGYSQDLDFKKYSYTELFEMIKAEKDTIFELSDAATVVDPITDLRFTHFKNVEDEASLSSFGWRWYYEGKAVVDYEMDVASGNGSFSYARQLSSLPFTNNWKNCGIE